MTRFDTYALQTRPPSQSVKIHKYLVQEKRRETKDRAVLPRQKRRGVDKLMGKKITFFSCPFSTFVEESINVIVFLT